jgi:histidine triad (HIT) family protein
MTDCIFCKIVSGNSPCYKISESDNYIHILDIFPNSAGHSLIIPKVHYKNAFAMPQNLLESVMKDAVKIGELIKSNLGASDIKFVQNNGALAGQVVMHYHLHVIPFYDKEKVSIDKKNFDQILNKLII